MRFASVPAVLMAFWTMAQDVTNPIMPKSGLVIQLTHVASLTSEASDVLAGMTTNSDFALSPAGEWVLLDSDNDRVVVLAFDGKVNREFGRSGQGPGEFEGATSLDVDQQGRVFVFDGVRRKCCVFSSDGTLEKDVMLPQGIAAVIRARIHPSGKLILTTLQMDENFQQTYMLSILDDQFVPVETLAKVVLPPTDWAAMGQPGFFESYMVQQFEALADGIPLGTTCGNRIVVATSNAYAGEIFDEAGNLNVAFTKRYQPLAYSQQAKEAICEAIWEGVAANAPFGSQITYPVYQNALKRAEFPPFVPPISELFTTARGFGVLANYDSVARVGSLDLFDCDGTCVATGAYRGLDGIIRVQENRLVVLGMGEEDEMELHVYTIEGI